MSKGSVVCTDCDGQGQVAGKPGANGLAMAVECHACNGTGKR